MQEILEKFQKTCDTLLTYCSIESNDSRSWDWEIKPGKKPDTFEVNAVFGTSDNGKVTTNGKVKYVIDAETNVHDAYFQREGEEEWIDLFQYSDDIGVPISKENTITAFMHNVLAGYDAEDMRMDDDDMDI